MGIEDSQGFVLAAVFPSVVLPDGGFACWSIVAVFVAVWPVAMGVRVANEDEVMGFDCELVLDGVVFIGGVGQQCGECDPWTLPASPWANVIMRGGLESRCRKILG